MAKTTPTIKAYDPNEILKSRVKRLYKGSPVFAYSSGSIKDVESGEWIIKVNKGTNPTGKGGKEGGSKTILDYSTRDLEDIKERIKYACSIDATVSEICYHADINERTLSTIFNEDETFLQICRRLKEQVVFEVRENLVKEAKKDPALGLRYLERKRRYEFATAFEHKHNHSIHKAVEVIEIIRNDPREIEEARNLKK